MSQEMEKLGTFKRLLLTASDSLQL